MGSIKQINIKTRTCYSFNETTNIKHFDSNLLKIDKKLLKNIAIYYIGCITMKSISDYESIHCVNSLCFIVRKVDGYTEESNGYKYLIFASTDKNEEVFKKYTEL